MTQLVTRGLHDAELGRGRGGFGQLARILERHDVVVGVAR
jgi:hypothetical protein